jgi:hypothetical protein
MEKCVSVATRWFFQLCILVSGTNVRNNGLAIEDFQLSDLQMKSPKQPNHAKSVKPEPPPGASNAIRF